MDRYRDIKEIAFLVRTQLSKEFPKCKFSVTIKRYSGGQSMDLSLMKAPFAAFAKDVDVNGNIRRTGYAQLNHYQLRDGNDEYISNGSYLTKEAFTVMRRAYQITQKYNWDESDPMIDYFNVNFYLHLNIGKWDKPFEVVKSNFGPITKAPFDIEAVKAGVNKRVNDFLKVKHTSKRTAEIIARILA